MEMISLPQTDLKVSRLCFGNMTFGGQTDAAAGTRMIDYCLDSGINFLDTANVYQKSESEKILGQILKGRRDKVVLASKVRGKMGDGPDDSGLSRAAILKAIDQSLARLQTDYLDLYYLHLPDYNVPIEETLDAMEDLVRAGKIRYPAMSNYASWQTVEMFWIAAKKGYRRVAGAQMMYNLLARGIEQEFIPMAAQYDLPLIVYNPLAGGMLTGKQNIDAPIAGSRFDNNQMYLDRYWHPQYFQAVEEVAEISRESGRSMISLSLNWLLHHTRTASVILGASKMEHLEANVAAAGEGPLAPEVIEKLNGVWGRLRGVTPKYNR
jgi:aryl-alcohol dehydrogenase-like predicted oxidoreductase